MRTYFTTGLLLGASLTAMAAAAQAQTVTQPQNPSTEARPEAAQSPSRPPVAAANTVGDIVVTAQRRAEVVTNVPISITVANQAQLEREQINSIGDLSRIAPALEVQTAPSQNTGGGGQIRGIGTLAFSVGAVASVGIVVDQVSQGNANLTDLFDIARVEVLKGPQGTLFGLTTSAGVINITTNAPDPRAFSGRVRTELSDAGAAGSKFGEQVVQGVVNLPVSENSALRISGSANLRQGPGHNVTRDGDVKTDRYSIRGRYLWQPSDRLTFNLIGDYAYTRTIGGGDFLTFIGSVPTQAAALAACGVTVRVGNGDFCNPNRIEGTNRNYGGSLQVDYDAGPVVLTSITSYRGNTNGANTVDIFRVGTTLPISIATTPYRTITRVITQEFRASSPTGSRLEYTVGAFYSRQETTQNNYLTNLTLRPPLSPLPFPITIPTPSPQSDFVDQSLAAFGQATFHLTDAFSLIAGGRYTDSRLSLDRTDFLLAGGSTFTHLQLNTDKISYRLGAQYNFDRHTMAYATASRGYKNGQITDLTNIDDPSYIVQPEIPQNYEIGFKTILLDGLILDLNAFHTRIRDFQANSCVITPSSVLACGAKNVSAVVTKGGEINLFGRVLPGLNVNTGLIYAEATYPKGYIGADQVSDLSGQEIIYSPKWKFSFSGEYEHGLTEGFNAFLAADAVWKSRIRYEENLRPEAVYQSHWVVGGRIGVRDADNRYEAAIFARNLFNQHEPILFVTGYPTLPAQNIGAIYGTNSFRQVGLSLSAKF